MKVCLHAQDESLRYEPTEEWGLVCRLAGRMHRGRVAVMIHEAKLEAEGLKEIRIKIPTALHVKLHSIRLLKGKSISEAVTEALEEYFTQAGARSAMPAGFLAKAAPVEILAGGERRAQHATWDERLE